MTTVVGPDGDLVEVVIVPPANADVLELAFDAHIASGTVAVEAVVDGKLLIVIDPPGTTRSAPVSLAVSTAASSPDVRVSATAEDGTTMRVAVLSAGGPGNALGLVQHAPAPERVPEPATGPTTAPGRPAEPVVQSERAVVVPAADVLAAPEPTATPEPAAPGRAASPAPTSASEEPPPTSASEEPPAASDPDPAGALPPAPAAPGLESVAPTAALVVAAPASVEAAPAEVVREPLETARRFPVPIALSIALGLYLLVQHRIDARDPKLAAAPLHDEMLGFS